MLKYCYLFPSSGSTKYHPFFKGKALETRLIVYIPQSRGGSRADGRLMCLLERFNLCFISVFGVISCAARERVQDFLVVM